VLWCHLLFPKWWVMVFPWVTTKWPSIDSYKVANWLQCILHQTFCIFLKQWENMGSLGWSLSRNMCCVTHDISNICLGGTTRESWLQKQDDGPLCIMLMVSYHKCIAGWQSMIRNCKASLLSFCFEICKDGEQSWICKTLGWDIFNFWCKTWNCKICWW
jgi:hypothetical protein